MWEDGFGLHHKEVDALASIEGPPGGAIKRQTEDVDVESLGEFAVEPFKGALEDGFSAQLSQMANYCRGMKVAISIENRSPSGLGVFEEGGDGARNGVADEGDHVYLRRDLSAVQCPLQGEVDGEIWWHGGAPIDQVTVGTLERFCQGVRFENGVGEVCVDEGHIDGGGADLAHLVDKDGWVRPVESPRDEFLGFESLLDVMGVDGLRVLLVGAHRGWCRLREINTL